MKAAFGALRYHVARRARQKESERRTFKFFPPLVRFCLKPLSCLIILTGILWKRSFVGDCQPESLSRNLMKNCIVSSSVKTSSITLTELHLITSYKKKFDNLDRTSFDNFVLKHPVQIYEPKELRWNDKPGPGYNLEEAKAVLRNRYTNVLPSIRFTLRRLKADAKVMGTIKRLRDNGWLDWHILFAISTITVNHRTYQRHEAHQSLEAFMKVWQEVGIENENWEPVPLTLFSEDDLLFGLRTTMPSTLKGLGLECHQLTPDIEAIDHFLRIRYRYWSDDIEHNDPFSV